MKKSVSKYIVLVILCSITNEPQTRAFVISYGFWGQEWGSSLAAWFCSESLTRLQSGCQPGGQSSGSWRICLQAHLSGSWQIYFLVGFWAEVLSSLPCGSLHRDGWVSLRHGRWFFPKNKQSERGRERERERGKKAVVPFVIQYRKWDINSVFYGTHAAAWKGLYKAVNTRGYWRPSWRLATTHVGKSKWTYFHEA